MEYGKSAKQRSSNIPTDAPKPRGIFCDVIQEVVNFRFQFQAKPGSLLFIPANGVVQFQRCKWPEADGQAHFERRYFCSSSALSCSHGMAA